MQASMVHARTGAVAGVTSTTGETAARRTAPQCARIAGKSKSASSVPGRKLGAHRAAASVSCAARSACAAKSFARIESFATGAAFPAAAAKGSLRASRGRRGAVTCKATAAADTGCAILPST